MKVFISWSGEVSKAVPTALHKWLPKVIQALKPWMSEHDIPKGKRWLSHMNDQLAEVGTGIICLTPDSRNAPWVLFEAGALAKSLNESFVCPYLFKLTSTTVEWPLAQFQLTEANKDDTLRLLSTINDALGDNKLTAGDLDESFEKWWPDLERDLQGIKPKVSESPHRKDRELLEEILALVRQLARAMPSARLSTGEGLSLRAAGRKTRAGASLIVTRPQFQRHLARLILLAPSCSCQTVSLFQGLSEAQNREQVKRRPTLSSIATISPSIRVSG